MIEIINLSLKIFQVQKELIKITNTSKNGEIGTCPVT